MASRLDLDAIQPSLPVGFRYARVHRRSDIRLCYVGRRVQSTRVVGGAESVNEPALKRAGVLSQPGHKSAYQFD